MSLHRPPPKKRQTGGWRSFDVVGQIRQKIKHGGTLAFGFVEVKI
jgi:hypothetical protein